MHTDPNLRFAALAFWVGLLDRDQYAAVKTTATANTSLPDLLVQRGWITPDERSHLEYLIDRASHKRTPGAEALYNLACIRALLSVATGNDKHAEHALELVRRAQEAGHFQKPQNRARLESDPSFKVIRSRPEFQQLLR